MKKKQTNTLDSWIDQSEMQRLTKALAPDDMEALGDHEGAVMTEVSGIGLPKKSMGDEEPVNYQATSFPAPDPQKTDGESLSVSDGAVGEGPVLRAARALAEVRLRADESGLLKRRGQKSTSTEPQKVAVPPVFDSSAEEPDQPDISNDPVPFEVPKGPLRVRLDAFASWAMQLAKASRIVIVDGQGYPLIHRDLAEGAGEGDSAMVDSAIRLTSVIEQVQARTDFARDAAMNLPLEDGEWLGVVRCENAGGRLCIAMVTPVPLDLKKSALMKGELARTMEAWTAD